jgi:hypothetical protein
VGAQKRGPTTPLNSFFMHKHVAENILAHYDRWVLKHLRADVRRHKSRNHFILFVMFSVALDNLASIRFLGEMPDKPRLQGGARYRRFITEYMPPKYSAHADLLYKGFRCKLVHQFQLDGFDLRQDRESRNLHLEPVEHGNVCLHSDIFLKDILSAFKRVKRDLVGRKAKPQIVAAFEKTDYKYWIHLPQ